MDLYNLITKIPYLVMLGVGLTLIINLYIGGLEDLSIDVDDASEEEYRTAIVLEHLLNVDATDSETNLEYDRRRAVIPAEFIKNENPGDDEIGYSMNDGHCYIEEVPGLDGANFGFSVNTPSHINTDCDNLDNVDSAESPVLLITSSGPPTEVVFHVYSIS